MTPLQAVAWAYLMRQYALKDWCAILGIPAERADDLRSLATGLRRDPAAEPSR